MPRYELVEGTSKKFWQIDLKGSQFTVRFGRIGTDGQEQVKKFATPAEARAAHDKLVTERPRRATSLTKPRASSRGPSPLQPRASASGQAASKSADTLSAIETYFEALRAAKPKGLDLYDQTLPPQKAKSIDAAEKKLGGKLPADVRAFLPRGLRAGKGSLAGEPFAALGFDFLPADRIAKHTQMLREVAADEHRELIERGFAITYSEPELVVADDGVYHFSLRNPLLHVAMSFTEFMEHWLAAGCFSSHSFDALYKKVKPHVPSDISPAKNVWVRRTRSSSRRSDRMVIASRRHVGH